MHEEHISLGGGNACYYLKSFILRYLRFLQQR